LDLLIKHHSEPDELATVKIFNKEDGQVFLDGLQPWAKETSKRYHPFNYGNLRAKIYSWFKRPAEKRPPSLFLFGLFPSKTHNST
jgi:hypothetical protein